MKNRSQIIFFIAAFCVIAGCSAVSFAQDADTKDPIDIAQAKCLETSHATMPRAKCYSEASAAWQKKVQDTYTALLKKLPPKQKETLKKGQTAWVQYQEQEEGLIVSLYPGKGTGYISVRIIEIMKPWKYRALELESHLNTVKAR